MAPEWLMGFGILAIPMTLMTKCISHLFIGMEKAIESPSNPPTLIGTTITILLVIIIVSYESFMENRKNTSFKEEKK